MLYKRRELQADICLIEIDLAVLIDRVFLLTDGNAASGTTRFFDDLSQLKSLPWDVLNSDAWFDKEDGKRKMCSEVLVYPKIDHKYIKALHFYNKIPELPGINKPKCITPKLYF